MSYLGLSVKKTDYQDYYYIYRVNKTGREIVSRPAMRS